MLELQFDVVHLMLAHLKIEKNSYPGNYKHIYPEELHRYAMEIILVRVDHIMLRSEVESFEQKRRLF
jgi:hypothetical protein